MKIKNLFESSDVEVHIRSYYEPHEKDKEHDEVLKVIKAYGGTYVAASDKGAYFKFKASEIQGFKRAMSKFSGYSVQQ